MGRVHLDREAQQEIGRSIIVDLLQAEAQERLSAGLGSMVDAGAGQLLRRRSLMPCSGWVGCSRWSMTTGSRTSSSPATTRSCWS